MTDSEKAMRLKLLQSLSDHLDGMEGDSLKNKFGPKDAPLSVEVAAPDKEGLAEGLEKAHDLAAGDSDDDSDEQRMMELLGKDDDEEKDDGGKLGNFFHR